MVVERNWQKVHC